MKISFESKFAKDLRNIKDGKLLLKIKELIIECKNSETLTEIKNVKKLQGYDAFYRIRIGDYRIGLEVLENELIFTRCLHRKDIYRYFFWFPRSSVGTRLDRSGSQVCGAGAPW
ncbi:MAG: type II toxin-antitoxin system RelE/ParE family toxin [Candidatus Methylumidiphilus sp.]